MGAPMSLLHAGRRLSSPSDLEISANGYSESCIESCSAANAESSSMVVGELCKAELVNSVGQVVVRTHPSLGKLGGVNAYLALFVHAWKNILCRTRIVMQSVI